MSVASATRRVMTRPRRVVDAFVLLRAAGRTGSGEVSAAAGGGGGGGADGGGSGGGGGGGGAGGETTKR
jgi:hypothetical protein